MQRDMRGPGLGQLEEVLATLHALDWDSKHEIEMELITLKLTTTELKLLTTLAADQLFRKEYIDPKMPGYRSNAEEMSLCRALVGRLRLMADKGCVKRTPSKVTM